MQSIDKNIVLYDRDLKMSLKIYYTSHNAESALLILRHLLKYIWLQAQIPLCRPPQ